MITEASLTVTDLKARAVDVAMERPVETAVGRIGYPGSIQDISSEV